MLEQASAALPNAAFHIARGERLAFDAATFDTVLYVAVLSYLDAPAAAVEWRRVMRLDGTVLLTAHEQDGMTSSRVMRQAAHDVGLELRDPNAASGSLEALQALTTGVGLRLVGIDSFRYAKPSRLLVESFDLQLSSFGADLHLDARQRAEWRKRFGGRVVGPWKQISALGEVFAEKSVRISLLSHCQGECGSRT